MTPRGWTIVVEAVRSLRSQPAVTTLVLLVSALVGGAALATTGESVVAEERALEAVDRLGARVIEVRSVGAPSVPRAAVPRTARLDAVVWAVGLGRVFDVMVPSVQRPVPAVEVVGSSPALRMLDPHPGMDPRAHVSASSADALGLDGPVGAVRAVDIDDAVYGIGGMFEARSPLADLSRFVLVDRSTIEPVDRMIVLVRSSEQVPAVVESIRTVIGIDDAGAVTVRASEALLDVRRVVQGEVGRFGREVVLLTVAFGTVVIAVVTWASLIGRRRDFGRRRALGATRHQLIALVVLQTATPGVVGVGVGLGVGSIRLQQATGSWGEPRFAMAVATLTVLAVLVASLPPAVAAAFRDPVAVLRVP